MTRRQAADRLLRMTNLRDATEACRMGAWALIDQPWLIGLGVCVGFFLGAIAMVVIRG